MNNWSVTMTTFPKERQWGARCEWLGLGHVLSIQVNAAPALRVILFGWSFYVGKLLPPPQIIRHDLGEIAASKGWKHQGGNEDSNERR